MTMFSFNVQSIFILIFFNLYFIGNTIASAHCRQGEYRVGEKCCPSCSAEMHVIKNCTEFTPTSCAPCREGLYQDHDNGRKQCLPCKKCDAGLKVKKSCTKTSDALCEILEGYFCVDSNRGGCMAAQRHLVCSPGQYISQRGTADKDTECLQCPDRTFSDGTITSCQPHTKCESEGLKLIRPGSDSTDSECAEDSNINPLLLTIGVITAVEVAVVGVIVGLIVLKNKREIQMKGDQTTPSSDKSSGSNQEPARRTYVDHSCATEVTEKTPRKCRRPDQFGDLLRWCGGEHPDRKHHCLVQQQLLSGQEGSAEGGVYSAECTICTTLPTPTPNHSLQDHERSSPPQQQTVAAAAVREAPLQSRR